MLDTMEDHETLRAGMVEALTRDLFGPYHGEEERIPDLPLQRYSTGILYPINALLDANEDDGGLGLESEESDTRLSSGGLEAGLACCNSANPSSCGLSFCCDRGVQELSVSLQCGVYERVKKPRNTQTPLAEGNSVAPTETSPASEAPTESLAVKAEVGGGAEMEGGWQRTPLSAQVSVPLIPGDSQFGDIVPGLKLHVRIREGSEYGTPVTVSAVNAQEVDGDSRASDICSRAFFQVHLTVTVPDSAGAFLERKPALQPSTTVSADELSMRLLYRHAKSFAIGHGCSANWSPHDGTVATVIETSFVPSYDVFTLSPSQEPGLPEFSVRAIAESSGPELRNMLTPLTDHYAAWIGRQRESSDVPAELREQAAKNLAQCTDSCRRIARGIALLETDRQVLQAFRLAHKAMLYQLAHSDWLKRGRPEEAPPDYDYGHSWYPFQLGFILQCLESIADPLSPARAAVDLLWFPTGGGKTEAYLGLTAFMFFLRRLKHGQEPHGGGGVAAIMRYTLRLLTADQFHRASMLVCACEVVRREPSNGLSGTAPISIGLWVGRDAAPNRLDSARWALTKLQRGAPLTRDDTDPMKLRDCPWCGSSLSPADYAVRDVMTICCPDPGCEFSAGIPVWLVDDDVYSNCPSLLLGTVDKFARIPWIKEAGRLFGGEGGVPAPELIIQDELHLISGPLGTMVGLYETAVDALCSRHGGERPKVIASTATIKNAVRQVHDLFWRDMRQFPPPALDARDSFFAAEDRRRPARRYVGVFCPGKSPKTAMVRTYGILLHSARNATAVPDAIRDPYNTLVGYFNSLRELGGMIRLLQDDIAAYLRYCAKRDGDESSYRSLDQVREMTSRVPSSDVDAIRHQLWQEFPDPDCLDVLLATNMISVGLDVPRLGLLTVAGQPKSTGEYIQSTSRVGRKWPGLVVTVYNWTRSRDRSHYERFATYHSRLYSEVEATSVTPFASRARDRGMHAVLVSLVRHLVGGMHDDKDAGSFRRADAEGICDQILERVGAIDSLELDAAREQLDEIMAIWERRCSSGELTYTSRVKPKLLVPFEEATPADAGFPTLNSLRNIDPPVGLSLEV